MQVTRMRKVDKEIGDDQLIVEVLNRATILRLGLARKGWPYVIPMNFAYVDGCIYLHTGRKGRKMDFLAQNDKVCFEVDLEVEMVPHERPCDWQARYASVVGYGRAVVLEDEAQRLAGLMAVVERYTGSAEHQLPPEKVRATAVIRIDIEGMTGRRSLG